MRGLVAHRRQLLGFPSSPPGGSGLRSCSKTLLSSPKPGLIESFSKEVRVCVVMALVYVQRGARRNTFRLYLCVWGMGGGSESDGEWKVLSLDALTC
jgi:hypothetical protein